MPIPDFSLAGSIAAPDALRPSERELEEENEKFFILAGDPRNHELADADYQAFVEAQARRLVEFENGASRRKVDGVFRPKPAVEHTDIFESVGVGQANHPADVARTKDAMTVLGLGGFDRTMERSTEATPEFFNALEASQRRLGVTVDGVMRPGGETNTAMKGAVARKVGGGSAGEVMPAVASGRDVFRVVPIAATDEAGGRTEPKFQKGGLDGLPAEGGDVGEKGSGGRTTAGGGSNGGESVSGSAQGSFPPLTKQDFLKIDRALRDQDARKVAELRAPKSSETLNEFSKTATSRAIAAGKIDDSTVRHVVLAIKHGSPWERAQAVAYLRRIEATNPEIVDRLQKSHPDVVFQAATRWARIEQYGLAKVADRVDPARLIFVIDGLDRYGTLTRAERETLKSEIGGLRKQFSPIGRYLEGVRIEVARQPNGPTQTFMTDQQLVERLKESGMLGAIATAIGATASVGGWFAAGAAATALSAIGGIATFLGVSDVVRQHVAAGIKRRRDSSHMTRRSLFLHILREQEKVMEKTREKTRIGRLDRPSR